MLTGSSVNNYFIILFFLLNIVIHDMKSDRVRTDPGKSWNFIVQNSRHGKSWKTMEIPGKSWNFKAALLDFLFPF